MALDLIVQEAEGMSDEALMEVLHYMQFIKITTIQKPTAENKRKKRRTGGIYRGQIRIAPDFDAPLEDFAEYM